jgi:hypothetical protein
MRNHPGDAYRILRLGLGLAIVLALGLSCATKPPTPQRGSNLPPLKVNPFAGLDPVGETTKQTFNFRPGPKPPPTTTRVETMKFPAAQIEAEQRKKAAPANPGALKVLRTQPKGKEELVGAVTVDFNQPMVPIASLAELRAQSVPLRITPRPAGRFRWLGTQTVAFEPEGRMPYATHYVATIPAGTRSALGGVLEKEVRFEFWTPRPALTKALPHRYSNQARPDTALALEFNQPVKWKELAKLIKLNARTGADFELVPRAKWEKLRDLGHYVVTWEPDRTVVLQPKRPLEKGTGFGLTIGPGLPGEGPLKTTTTLTHSFATYSPLRVDEIRCGDYSRCNPASGLFVRFNNALSTPELEKFIEVTPKVEGLEIEGSGSYAYLRGEYAAQTSYTVKIKRGAPADSLRRGGGPSRPSQQDGPVDIHDQPLSAEAQKTLRMGNITPNLSFPVQGLASLERRGKRQVRLEVANVSSTRLRLVQVDPAQVLKAIELARYSWDDEGRRDPIQAAKLKGLKVTRTLTTGIKANAKGKIGLSTDEGLGPSGTGPLYIELRCAELQKEYRWNNPFRGIVVQVTDLGIMARYDNDQIVALVTRMEAGTPLAGAKIELRDGNGEVIWRGASDKAGLVRAPGRRALQKRAPFVLWASAGDDRAFVILGGSGDDGNYLGTYYNYSSIPPKERLAMHLFTDRSPYRPGETVHLKGVLRVVSDLPDGGVRALEGTTQVEWEVKTAQGHKLKEGKSELSASGAFAVDLTIPEGSDLGAYRVQVKPTSGPFATYAHGSFQVEEYRPPEFAVKVEVEGEPYFFKDKLKASVGADYLFGAPMSGAQVSWTLNRSEGRFVPPGNEGFTFGDPVPWRFGWRVARGVRRHREGMRTGYSLVQNTGEGTTVEQGQGALDAKGRLKVEAPLEADPEVKRIGPASFTLEAQVFDQNRQSIANRKTFVVHPASRYVGLKAEKSVVKEKEPFKVNAVLVDLKGKRIAGEALTVEAVQIETKWKTVFEDGRWTYKFEDKERKGGSCELKTAEEAQGCTLELAKAGSYQLRVTAKDEKGRTTRSAVSVYVFGPGYVPWSLKNQSDLELVPDKQEYRPGEVAKVLIKSPLRKTVGLLSVLRGGIDRIEPIKMDGNAQLVEIPIKDHHLPELFVAVSLARGRDGSLGKAAQDLGRPTFAHGSVRLPVSLDSKTVEVAVKPRKEAVGPQEKLTIDLSARGPGGKPVRAELAVMLVDEGVLSLMNYQTPDPLAFFFPARGAGAPLADLRNALLGKEELKPARQPKKKARGLGLRGAGRGGGGTGEGTIGLGTLGTIGKGGGGGSGSGYGRGDGLLAKRASAAPAAPAAQAAAESRRERKSAEDAEQDRLAPDTGAAPRIRARSSFATTAYYNPSVTTDEAGKASITVPMPDNLTTYRIMAVALDRGVADRFGKGEAQVKVRKPLLLRPSLPRFLSTGDTFEAAVMVHNESEADGVVDVLVRGRGVKALEENRLQVKIAKHAAKEVRFKLAQEGGGPARIQFAAVLQRAGGSAAGAPRAERSDQQPATDAVEKQIPVLLPVTTEAFATYGMTDQSVAQPVTPPKDALAEHGGLKVSMSSTALNGLEDAVSYLVDYPYECTEQTASRVLPIFSLGAILKDFGIAKVKDLASQKALAGAGVRKLLAFQRYDGGWGNWQGSRLSWPYLSAYATYALLRAKEAGEKIPDYNLQRARSFLKYRLDYPMTEFLEQYNYVAQTASVWILSELKQHETNHLTRLYGLRGKLPMFAKVWLMVALFRAEGRSARVNEILRELNNAAVQTAAAAHFAEGKSESLRLLMHSEDRTDAIVLQALLEVDPNHALMPKVARGLLDARVRGRWSTTQANAFALVALARYYKQVENVVPDFVSQIWYGEGYMGEAKFKGREMKVAEQEIPMHALQKLGPQELVLQKAGPGKLYYRVGLNYAPKDLKLPPEEQGFSVSRVYEPIADPKTGKVRADEVKRRKDGTWEIKAGATVRVRLVVVVPDYRYFVAIADPLPAGLEGVNLSFATSARSALAGQLDNRTYDSWSWYSLFAFDHREMRDDRVVLFADRLPAGVYEYTYLARATTFGRFVVAPVKAEEMYHPETFGRAATAFVEVR